MVFAVVTAALLYGCGGGGSGGGNPPPVPAVTDINGTATASGTTGSLFIVDGSGFGTLSGTGTTAGYSVDFRDASTNAIVATAPYAGSNWQDIYIKATVPTSGLTAGTTYNVTVTTPGGTSNKISIKVVASVAFSPSTISWASTSALPTAMQGFPTVVAPITSSGVTTTYVYALGGNTGASGTTNAKNANLTTVAYNQIVTALPVAPATTPAPGSLVNASWSTTTVLPAARGFAAGALANGYNSKVSGNGTVYVIGGLDATGAATSTVYYAALNADGTIPASGAGSWTATSALPQALSSAGAVVFHGRMYVAGGNDASGNPVSTVYSAPVKSDGTLGSWTTSSALTTAVAYHQLVTLGGNLYVVGGTTTASADPTSKTQSAGTQSAVSYNPINFIDGSLATTWATTSSLIHADEKHTAVAVGGYVLVSGGLYNGASTGATEESYAALNADGVTLSSFTGATGSHTISGTTGGYNFFNHSVAVSTDDGGTPHVLILGGGDVNTGALQTGVWYIQ